jgi:hypothetical protein
MLVTCDGTDPDPELVKSPVDWEPSIEVVVVVCEPEEPVTKELADDRSEIINWDPNSSEEEPDVVSLPTIVVEESFDEVVTDAEPDGTESEFKDELEESEEVKVKPVLTSPAVVVEYVSSESEFKDELEESEEVKVETVLTPRTVVVKDISSESDDSAVIVE